MSETGEGGGAQPPKPPEPASGWTFWGEQVVPVEPVGSGEQEPPAQFPVQPTPQYPTASPPARYPAVVPPAQYPAVVPPARASTVFPSGQFPVASSPLPVDTVVTAPVRPRRRGAKVVGLIACTAVAGAGTWLGLGMLDKAPELTASEQMDQWDHPASATEGQEPQASWTVAWDATYQLDLDPYTPDYLAAPAVFDDGLDHANLPPLVERTSPRYPEAHQITDEIWAQAGPGWMLASYHESDPCQRPLPGESNAEAVLDLVSPEGVHFRLLGPGGVPISGSPTFDYLSVTHANLAERSVIASLGFSGCGDSGNLGQALIDLTSGETVAFVEEWPYGEVVQAVGPFPGGAEVRLRHHSDAELAEGDGLFVWTPEDGEVAVDLPEGIALGDLNILGVADAEAGMVVLDTPTEWTQNSGDDWFADRMYLLDVTTRELWEVFPTAPIGRSSYIGGALSSTGVVVWASWIDPNLGYTSTPYMVPWDGSTPLTVDREEAIRLKFEPMGLVPVVECEESYCRVVAVTDVSGREVLLRGSAASYRAYAPDGTTAAPWGRGPLTVVSGLGPSSWVVEFDPSSGTRLEPFTAYIPETGARSALDSVFVFSAAPGEG